MRPSLPSLLTFCACLAACQGGEDYGDTSSRPPAETDTDTGTSDTDDVDTGNTSPDAPTWWELDGLLMLQQEQAVPEGSRFVLELRSKELAVLCNTQRDVASMELVDPPVEPLYRAWDVTLADGEGCEHPLPVTFLIGVGPYDHRLDPAAASHGLDPTALFGLYVQLEGRPLHVFGVAGTSDQFSGTPVEAPPLPDGSYALDGLHLLPL